VKDLRFFWIVKDLRFFFFARLVTRSLCSCVLMCFVLIYLYFVFGFSFGYVLVYSLDLLVYLPLVHSYSIFIIKNKIKSSSIGLLGVLFYYYFFFFSPFEYLFCPLLKFSFMNINLFFYMYNIIYFFPIGCLGVGGCPSPRACWAYPKAGPDFTLPSLKEHCLYI
jgi:hypothetical protein